MRFRAVLLIGLASVLLIHQLPLEPRVASDKPACCLMGSHCPMSAAPASKARVGAACSMKRTASCSMRAACSTGRHEGDGSLTQSASARPAVLAESIGPAAPELDSSAAIADAGGLSSPVADPPEPPPRRAFA